MENFIPEFWEREREWKIAFPTFGNGNGNEKLIPKLWEREWEAVFPGMVGNGNSRSPLACAWLHISDLSLILNFKFKDVEEENIEFDRNVIFIFRGNHL